MADLVLKAPWTYVLALVPLAAIVFVIGLVTDWSLQAFAVLGLFLAAVIAYGAWRKK